MNKKIKIIIITIIVILLVIVSFGIVDKIRSTSGKLPLFTIYTKEEPTKRGELYYGFGYVVVRCIEREPSYREYVNFQILSDNYLCFKGIYN